MELSSEILSRIIVFTKYAKYREEFSRRENWEELNARNSEMHVRKYPQLADEIRDVYENFVKTKKVLPSMRSLQFGGKPIEINPARQYNCLSRDTKFVTSQGVKSFEDFEDGDETFVLSANGTWNTALVRNYGKQVLYELTFKRGKSVKKIKATRNHRWLLKDGTETTKIQIGDQLLPTKDTFSDFEYDNAEVDEKLYWAYGYVYGDGTKVKQNGKYARSMVRLCGSEKEKYLHRFQELGFQDSSPLSCGGDVMVYTGTYLKVAPNPEVDAPHLIRAFVRGYLDADGAKINDRTMPNQFRSIQSSEEDHISFIEKCFAVAGMFITAIRDLTGQETNFGTRPKTSLFGLNHIIGKTSKKWSLCEMRELGTEEVWCLEVENTKNFVLDNGMPTGNCSYLPIDDWRAFSEIMFLLLGGTGVGYSVQRHHVEKLPEIRKPQPDRPYGTRRFLIGDSIEGWADAVRVLMRSYFDGRADVVFDFSDIRQKGARLVTSGGKAPGPEPLKICLRQIKSILNEKEDGDQLTPLEVHDIICHIADAVLAGGIRRAALISLFSADDNEMLSCKFGSWWENNPQRARANNSAVLLRHRVTKGFFLGLWDKIAHSKSGEPGIFFTNDKDIGTNPCKPLKSRILTKDGFITFKDALEKDFLEVVLPNGNIARATKPFKTGENRNVYRVTLSNGLSLFGTENHLHQNHIGEWKRIDELKVGDKLSYKVSQRSSLSVDNAKEYEQGLLHGWLYADGWNFDRSDAPGRRAGLCFGSQEFDVIPIFERITGNIAKSHYQKPSTCKTLFVNQKDVASCDKTQGISWIHTKTSDYKLGFLRSFFTADGSVRNNNNVEVYSIKKDWLEELSLLLQEFGIRSTVCVHSNDCSYVAKDGKQRNNKTCFKLNVFAGQFKRIGFLSKNKNVLLEKQKDKGLYRRRDYETIASIDFDGVEDVYDITVEDESHAFIDTGVVTHNCAEISLRPCQFCVSGDTKLITRQGLEVIENVVGKEIEIWNGQKWSKVKPFQTGDKDRLHRVYFSDGSFLDATDNHKFLVKNRFEDEFREVETIELIDILQTSKYQLQVPRANIVYDDGFSITDAYDYGFVLGNGVLHQNGVYGNLYGDDKLLEFKTAIKQGKELTNAYGTKYQWVKFDISPEFANMLKHDYGLPKQLFTWNKRSILEFVAGWADADGSQASKGIRIYGREDKIRDAQLLLTKIGINSSVNLMAKKGQWTNLGERKNDVWYLQITKTNEIPCQRLVCDNEEDAKCKEKYQTVKSIETLEGFHKSFCLTENELHQCVFNNVLTKQCNLCEINADGIDSQEEFEARVRAATIIGTLQAGYTDFHYLRPIWKRQTEKEALLGIGLTGVASGTVQKLYAKNAAKLAIAVNKEYAAKIGINEAARLTCMKPSGTSSLVLGGAAGIHAWHSEYFIRRLRLGKNEAIYKYLVEHHPELLEDDFFKPHTQAIITVPIKAPEGAITRKEPALELLERVKWFNENWIRPGHRKGNNRHNVSATITIKEHEWDEVGEWMWENREYYNGLSVLPYDDHTYVQAPFEDITEETYEKLVPHLKNVDLTRIKEEYDMTSQKEELACSAGGCTIESV